MSSNMAVIPNRLGALWTYLAILFVAAPLIALIGVSLSAAPYISFPWNEGFSLRWYIAIPDNPGFLSSALNSLVLALLASVAAVAIGSGAALAVVRYSFPGRDVLAIAGTSPLFVPNVLIGLALAFAVSASGILNDFLALLVGHVVIIVPFVLRISTAALTDFNLDQERAAQNLGASKMRAFALVTFPQVRSGIAAGAILAFIVSFDNIALSIFLSSPGYDLLPVYLYDYASDRMDGLASAVSVSLIALSVLGVLVLEWLVGLDKVFGGDIDA